MIRRIDIGKRSREYFLEIGKNMSVFSLQSAAVCSLKDILKVDRLLTKRLDKRSPRAAKCLKMRGFEE